MNLQKPLIHLNGSPRAHLQEAYEQAYRALGEAWTKVAQSAPNQRDYYPLGEEAWKRARAQHEWRLNQIAQIRQELLSLFESCEERR